MSLPAQVPNEEEDAIWRQLSVAEGYAELRMFAEAHSELDLVDQRSGYRLDVAERKLDLFLAEERWKDAAIYGELMTEFDPDDPSHFVKYATALHALGRTDTAIYALSLAPDELERDPECQYRLAGYELEAGTREEALYHLENAVALNPKLREAARIDVQLARLVAEVPEQPRFVPSQPEYVPEPSGVAESTGHDEAEDTRDHEFWGLAGFEVDVFGNCYSDPGDPDDDEGFECPF